MCNQTGAILVFCESTNTFIIIISSIGMVLMYVNWSGLTNWSKSLEKKYGNVSYTPQNIRIL